MSGKIIFKTREGVSKMKNYDRYLEWYWEIEGEDGVKTNISPRFVDLVCIIKQIMEHERMNDLTRKRQPDYEKKSKMIKDATDISVDLEDIPEIYFKVNSEKIKENLNSLKTDNIVQEEKL
jgi:hypothetical protein